MNLVAEGPQLKQHMRTLRAKFGAKTKIGRRASNVEEALAKFGAKTKIGRRASNVEEALIQYPDPSEIGEAVEFKRSNIEKSVRRWLTELNGLLTEA